MGSLDQWENEFQTQVYTNRAQQYIIPNDNLKLPCFTSRSSEDMNQKTHLTLTVPLNNPACIS